MSLRGPPRRATTSHPLAGVDPAFAYSSGSTMPFVGQCTPTGDVKLPIQAILEVGRREGYGVTQNVKSETSVGCGAPMEAEEDNTLNELVRSFEKAKNGIGADVGSARPGDTAIFHSHSKLATGGMLFGSADVGFGGPVTIGALGDGESGEPQATAQGRMSLLGSVYRAVADRMHDHVHDSLGGMTNPVAGAMARAANHVPPGMGSKLLTGVGDGADTDEGGNSSSDDESSPQREAGRLNGAVDEAVDASARLGADPEIAPHASAAAQAVLSEAGGHSAHSTIATSRLVHSSPIADTSFAAATAAAVSSLARPSYISQAKWKEFTDSLIDVSTAIGHLNSAAHKNTAFDMWNTVNRELQLKITALRHERAVKSATNPAAANTSDVMALSYGMLSTAHRNQRHGATTRSKAYVTSLAALQGTDLDMNQRDLHRLLSNIGASWKKVKASADNAWKSVEDRHADYVANGYLKGIVALGNNERLLERAHVLSKNLQPEEVQALNRATAHLMSERTARERSDIVEAAHRAAGDEGDDGNGS